MPPSKARANQSPDEELEDAERSRLRTRAESSLIQKQAPKITTHSKLPVALRRCDGADIVKRNTSRKKRYLIMFPGGFQLKPGANLGLLDGLATGTPRLTIDCRQGRILLKGFLAFPKNSLMVLKPSSAAGKRVVQVVDCFETVVVFSEWAWVGVKDTNPGSIPEPLPKTMVADDAFVWPTPQATHAHTNHAQEQANEQDDIMPDKSASNRRTPAETPRTKKQAKHPKFSSDSDSGSDSVFISDDGEAVPPKLANNSSTPSLSASRPRRQRLQVKYTQSSEEEGEGNSEHPIEPHRRDAIVLVDSDDDFPMKDVSTD